MKKLFLLTALFVAAAFPSCSKHDNVETPDLPDPPAARHRIRRWQFIAAQYE
ncbi:hypothetical protein [uncultured Alistipes sp.]|uniref:hypothetical protein n=1 Tax=uncultured Alistipes sp. TaxID=538949 RepID=UPI00272C3A9C|nr:hypothetical protein [uncultured Alistipes sp.]